MKKYKFFCINEIHWLNAGLKGHDVISNSYHEWFESLNYNSKQSRTL